jgi:hypothetical protein
VARYFYENRVVDIYGQRNSFRMAPYHRADISCTLYPKKYIKKKTEDGKIEKELKKRKVESNWNFSVYNLYNRMNPYFIYFGNSLTEAGVLEIKAYQVSLFPILPSVTWNFKF